MAYNDYGAFVFCDGKRRKDKEDVFAFEEQATCVGVDLASLPSASRIYAVIGAELENAGKESGTDTAARPFWERMPFHSVLGDGDVRLCIYKADLNSACLLIRSEDGDVECIDGFRFKDLATNGACDASAFAYRDDEAWEDRDARLEAYFKENEVPAYIDDNGYIVPPFSLSFSFAGHAFAFEAKERENALDAPAWYDDKPYLHAVMKTPDGNRWDCFCDAAYGAGWMDEALGELQGDGTVSPFREMNALTALSELPDFYVEASVVATPEGDVLYQGERAFDGEDGYGTTMEKISTLPRGSFIDPADFIEILNMGIALHRKGIERVSDGTRGCWFDSNDYIRNDHPFAEFVRLDEDGLTELDRKKKWKTERFESDGDARGECKPFWYDYFPLTGHVSEDNESAKPKKTKKKKRSSKKKKKKQMTNVTEKKTKDKKNR